MRKNVNDNRVTIDINNYRIVDAPKKEDFRFLTGLRAVSANVIKDFLSFIKQIEVNYKNNGFYNVCFPYVTLYEDKITNLEIRIRNTNFKDMTADGNKRNGECMRQLIVHL